MATPIPILLILVRCCHLELSQDDLATLTPGLSGAHAKWADGSSFPGVAPEVAGSQNHSGLQKSPVEEGEKGLARLLMRRGQALRVDQESLVVDVIVLISLGRRSAGSW